MVACDNAECPYEWFHFECVGLSAQPHGAWFCPECAPDQQLKNRRPNQPAEADAADEEDDADPDP